MQIVHTIDVDPEQYVAEEHARNIRPPVRCPHCRRDNTLWALGYYIRNLSRMGAGALRLSIRRFRCCDCRKTVSLLPAFVQPYRFVQNRTIELFARGAPFSDEVIRHIEVLGHYWRRFSKKIIELEQPLGLALGRAPPVRPREVWSLLMSRFSGLESATQSLTSQFQITVFGRYRCHRPNEAAEK